MTKPARNALQEHGVPNEPWAVFAARWARLGPPLRPCPEDVQRVQKAWLTSLPDGIPRRRIEVLSLGVTPELALFPWAEQTSLRALDASAQMIRSVWPGDDANRRPTIEF